MKSQTLAAQTSVSQGKYPLSVMAVLVALFLAAMDSTAVSTILPQINAQLQDTTLYPWIVSGFLLPLALVAPLAGALADRFGVSTVMKISLLLFIGASAWIASSQSMLMLIVGRALQGTGAGGIIVLSYSLLASLFEGPRRANMQGMLSGVWGLAAILGPVAGAVLGSTLSWRAVFWLNLPLGALALLALCFAPTVGRGQLSRHVDLLAQGALAIFACAGLFLLSGHPLAWMAYPLPTLVVIMLISLLVLLARVRKVPRSAPVPLGFFAQPALGSTLVLVVTSSIGLYASVSLLPVALSQGDAGGALSSGALIMLAALGWVAGATFCGKRLARVGFRPMAAGGMSMLLLGCLCVAAGLRWAFWPAIAVGQVLIGSGMGFTATTTLVFAQNSAPADQLGAYTSTVQFLRSLGAAFGVNGMVAIALHLPPESAYPGTFLLLGLVMGCGLLFAYGLPVQHGLRED